MEVVGHVPESQPEFPDCVEEFDREKVDINFLNFERLLNGFFFKNHVKKLKNMFLNKKLGVIYKKTHTQIAVTATTGTVTTITFLKISLTVPKLKAKATIFRS